MPVKSVQELLDDLQQRGPLAQRPLAQGVLEGMPLPPEIQVKFNDYSSKFELSISDRIKHEEDIPFDLWEGRTYSLSLDELQQLQKAIERAMLFALPHEVPLRIGSKE